MIWSSWLVLKKFSFNQKKLFNPEAKTTDQSRPSAAITSL